MTNKPTKNEIVDVWHPTLGRFVRGKWSGRRWMIFHELFGGWDPATFEVEKWRIKSLCNLDRGICSNQYGLGCFTGCSAKEPCKDKIEIKNHD